MIGLSVAVGAGFALVFLGLGDVIPRIFTSDPEVLAQCALLWPLFALMQPLNGAVFALDGILIGASDGAYLALSMVVAFVVFAVALAVVSWADWGVRGVWAALTVLIVTRLVLMGARFRAAAVARYGVRLSAAGRSQLARTAHLREPGAQDVAVRVGGQVVPSLARLGHEDIAADRARVADALARAARSGRPCRDARAASRRSRGSRRPPTRTARRPPPARRRRARASSPSRARALLQPTAAAASGRP